MSKKLTDKQEMFCREYLLDMNATQAAIRAGYSEKTAKTIAGQNLSKLIIQSRIAELKAERIERVEIDADWVLVNAKRVFDRCMQDEPILTASGDPVLVKTEAGELAAAYKFDSSGANKAIELIGKHVGVQAFKNKIEHTGANGGAVEVITLNKEEYKKARQEMLEDDDC